MVDAVNSRTTAASGGVDRYFKITERGSTVGREVRGGVVTFFTMAYIIVLNPIILSGAQDVDGNFLGGADGFVAIAAGTALVAGYTLAGELAAAAGDHTVAFPRYEARIGPFARRAQGGGNAGRFLAPKTARGLAVRNWLNNQSWFMSLTYRIAGGRSSGINLPDYAASRPLRPSARPGR